MTPEILIGLKVFAPELVIVGFLVLLFFLDGFFPKLRHTEAPLFIILLACLSAAVLTHCIAKPEKYQLVFSGLIAHDSFAVFFRYLFFAAGAATAYLAYGSSELKAKSRVEFSLLLLCITFGLSLMAMATNLLVLYIGIETVSIISFVLAGFHREDARSNEASFKYLVFGAMASGLMIYGFSLIYGYTGSLSYTGINTFLTANPGAAPLTLNLSLILVYLGLAYKIAAFPMHFWTPDVYEGSPTPVAAFFSIGPKAAGFAAFVRIFRDAFSVKAADGTFAPLPNVPIVHAVAVVSAATMLVGNLSAIGQRSVKRMLGYSSIAHVGYMLMGLVAYDQSGLQAILFYLVAYYAMNFGAFWVVSIVVDLKNSDDLEAFKGIGWSMPVLGVCMGIFLFSLTGIPLFVGFIGKFVLFAAVLKTPGFLWLAILGVLNSVVSLYYYSKILKAMWLERPQEGAAPLRLSVYHAVGLIALAAPTIIFGLFYTPIWNFAERSLGSLL